MKKLLFLFVSSLWSIGAWAYDFMAAAPTGQTLYFNVVSESNRTVGVVLEPFRQPSGDLEIPSTVVHNGITYTVTELKNYQGYGAFQAADLTSVIIPNTVTSIGDYAFAECVRLVSVTIPNSVTSIGGLVFNGCNTLTNIVVEEGNPNYDSRNGCNAIIKTATNELIYGSNNTIIPNSIRIIGANAFWGRTELASITIPESVVFIIGNYAFFSCPELKTIYNLSGLSIGTSSYGLSAKRVIKPTKFGTGNNAIYQIDSTTYSFVDVEDDVATHIPRSTIPANFLYKDGGSWLAKEIVLTDDTNRFETPVAFTADTVTYIREFTNSNRSTLYLPFTASVPANFEVYDFSNFENNTLYFTEHTGDIAAYTPYLVGYNLAKDGTTTKCIIAQGETDFPASVEDNFNTESHGGMTFQGVLERTEMTSTNNYGYSNGFFVQSGGSAHVNPFRCFFSYSSSNPMGIPPTLIVDIVDGELAIDEAEMPAQQTPTYYSNDVYDMMGRLIRRNAQSLEGLPKGVYIWKGQKVLAY